MEKQARPPDDFFTSDDRAAETEAAPGLRGCAELHEPLSRAIEAPTGGPLQTALPFLQVRWPDGPITLWKVPTPPPALLAASLLWRAGVRHSTVLLSTLEETQFTFVP